MSSTTLLLYLSVQLLTIIKANPVEVNVENGFIQGEVNTYGVLQYMKIPYAKPPINNLRWAPPQPADAWQGTLNATIQDVPACLYGKSKGVESEDCLYLSIWAPPDAEFHKTKYAVMIYLHGGSFDFGESDEAAIDPTNLVNNIGDIIVVIPNYRLGLLGFLYDNAYNTGVNGNYGIQDQQLAIKWIYENIDYFGGNNQQITLLGYSSGATSVAIHLVYNNQHIKAGIMMSATFNLPLRTPETWYDVVENFNNLTDCVNKTNTNTLACWRSIAAVDILQLQKDHSSYGITGLSSPGQFAKYWPYDVTWCPTKNTAVLPDDPFFAIQNENIETPPFMIGNTKDEGWLYITDELLSFSNLISYQVAFGMLQEWYGNAPTYNDYTIVGQIFNEYGITDSSTHSGESYLFDVGIIQTDNWVCSIRKFVSNSHKKIKPNSISDKTYYYSFDVVDSSQFSKIFSGRGKSACFTRTCHEIDLYYLLLQPAYEDIFNNDTLLIGREMQELWTNYAKTLNPNVGRPGKPWPRYCNRRGPKYSNFLQISGVDQFTPMSITQHDNYHCAFWDQIGYAGEYNAAVEEEDAHGEEGIHSLLDGGNGNIKNTMSFVYKRYGLIVVIGISVMINMIFVIKYCICGNKQQEKQKFEMVKDEVSDDEVRGFKNDINV